MSKSDHIHDEKKQFESREKLVRLLQRMDQPLRHKKRLRHRLGHVYYSSIIGWLTSCVLAKKNVANYMVFPPNVRTQSRTMTTHGRTIHRKPVFVYRKSHLDRHKSPMRCTYCIGRPRAGSSRLTSAIHGRTGRRRIWIILQWWQTIRKTPLPYIPETFEQIWRATWGFLTTQLKNPQSFFIRCALNAEERQGKRPFTSTQNCNTSQTTQQQIHLDTSNMPYESHLSALFFLTLRESSFNGSRDNAVHPSVAWKPRVGKSHDSNARNFVVRRRPNG